MKNVPFRIWIGYDHSESRAYDVCVKSIQRRATIPIEVYPLRQEWLRSLGIYWRQRDPLASTEFSFSRFLVPTLAGFHGPAMFVDADFVFLADIAELLQLYNPFYAVQCVWHSYEPTHITKMGGIPQTQYPRKNWSSLMLMNTGHPDIVSGLTPNEVNIKPGSYLHQFQWTRDEFIGTLPSEWNILENGDGILHPQPKGLHFTRGLPTIHPGHFDYSDIWKVEMEA